MPQIFRPEPGLKRGSNRRYRVLLRRMRKEPLSLVGQYVVVVQGLLGEDDMNVIPFKLVSYIPGPIGRTGHYLGPDGTTPVYVAGGKARFGEEGLVYTFPTMSQFRRRPNQEVQDLITETEHEVQTETIQRLSVWERLAALGEASGLR